MIEIKQQLTDTKNKYGGRNGKRHIVVHQTGNTSNGADAKAHANLQSKGNVRQASWHIQVDDKEAIQSFSYDVQCWHAGDGRGQGNLNGIAIEICINSDGNYTKSVENGAKVVAKLIKDLGLTINDVKQHHNFSGKNCPAQIRAGKAGINWNKFLGLVKAELEPKNESKPVNTYVVQRGDTLSEIARYFNTTVNELAKVNNIKNPSLIFIGQVLKVASAVPKKKYTKGLDETSIVDFLKLNGESSSMANRKKLATAHGIKGYEGSAEQNTKLLNVLKKL